MRPPRPSTLGRPFPLLAKPSSMDCIEAVTRSLIDGVSGEVNRYDCDPYGQLWSHIEIPSDFGDGKWEIWGPVGNECRCSRAVRAVTNACEPKWSSIHVVFEMSLAEDNSNSSMFTAEPSSNGRSCKVRLSILSGATSSWKLLIGITLGFSNSVRYASPSGL
jgi:hypothetical protein